MRNVKRKSILAGAVAAAASAIPLSSAHGAFTVTYSSTISGSNTVYYLSALNTGGTTGTKLVGENFSIATPGTGTAGAIQFQYTDVDADGVSDANIFGQGVTTSVGGSPGTAPNIKTSTIGTFSRIGALSSALSALAYDSVANTGITPANYRTNLGNVGAPTVSTSYTPTQLDSVFTTKTLHYLDYQLADAAGSSPAANVTPVVFADVVVPTGTVVTIAGSLGGDTGAAVPFTTLVLGAATATTSTTTGTNKIVSLLSTASSTTAPNGYGTAPLGTLTVTNAGGAGKYFPGYFSIPGGATSGYVAVSGFLATDAPEVYALKVAVGGVVLAPTDTRIATIISDITGSEGTGVTGVSAVTAAANSSFAGVFAGYDILVTTSASASPYFAFDFSSSGSDTTDGDAALGSVTVTSIAAVPEPATAAGIILGASGLLLGRRKNRAVAV